MYRGRGRCGGAALAPGGLALFAVRVLGVGVPGQPLLVEGDDDLGTLEVRLFRQHQVGLVCVLPGGVGTPKKKTKEGGRGRYRRWQSPVPHPVPGTRRVASPLHQEHEVPAGVGGTDDLLGLQPPLEAPGNVVALQIWGEKKKGFFGGRGCGGVSTLGVVVGGTEPWFAPVGRSQGWGHPLRAGTSGWCCPFGVALGTHPHPWVPVPTVVTLSIRPHCADTGSLSPWLCDCPHHGDTGCLSPSQ